MDCSSFWVEEKHSGGCSALPLKHSDSDELKTDRQFYLPGQSDFSTFPLQCDFLKNNNNMGS